jgi:dipeptidyl aminopeptidase/acylaminoacyl peptidase
MIEASAAMSLARMIRTVRSLLLATVLVGMTLSGSPPAPLQAQEPGGRPVPPGVRVVPDVVFRVHGAETLRLDLLLPMSGAPVPAIVYVGGADGSGRADLLWTEAVHLATLGFAGALIDYRPRAAGTRMPIAAAVSDAKLAVRWLRAHAGEYGLDGSRIGMVGAGPSGLVAALAGLPQWFGVGSNDNVSFWAEPGAVALIEVPLDLADDGLSPAIQDVLDAVLATPDAAPAAGSERNLPLRERISPVSYFGDGATRDVREHVPPFLFLHGTADEHVPFRHSEVLARALQTQGLTARLFTAEEARQGFFRTPEWSARTLAVLGDFFRSTLAGTVFHAGWLDSRPAWAPDGERIAFHSNYGGEMGIWIMNADGSALRRIARGREPTWSPDGSRLAFESGEGRLASVRIDGSDLVLLTRDTAEFVHSVSWSPDGAHIAYSSWADDQLYVIRVADGHVRRLTDAPGGNACSSWFPDGSRIAFHSGRDGQAELYVAALDGTFLDRLTDTPAHEFCPSVSPDGRRIVFQRRASELHEHIDLFAIELDSRTEVNLTNHAANDRYASWSPDGRWIAFASTRGGNSDIYVISADGTELQRLTSR